MTYAILYIENGDIIADFELEAEARAEVSAFVAEHPSLRDRVAVLAFDEHGQPVGDVRPGRELQPPPR